MEGMKASKFALEMGDREAIRDCIFRWFRAIDRCDRALAKTTFWDDATDDHGLFVGSFAEFAEWGINKLLEMQQTQHMAGNILIRIDGDTAYSETYLQAYHRALREDGTPYDYVIGARYLDRFERRDDEWRVAHRKIARDWFRDYQDSGDWDIGPWGMPQKMGGRMPDDASYDVLKW